MIDDGDVETGGDGDAAHDEDDGYEDGNWTFDTKMVVTAAALPATAAAAATA